MAHSSGPSLGTFLYTTAALVLGSYFCFAAVQGSRGIMARADVAAEKTALEQELAGLNAEIARLEGKTRRLSDDYLDLDLLDERVRLVLGFVRPDEIVIQ